MAVVYRRKDEDLESLLKRFKKSVQNEGIMEEYRKKEFYVSPSLKRKLKSIEAQKRDRRAKKFKYVDKTLDY